ncbi:MAG: RIP metalloprotease RseP [Chloroflexi bacterium]|nr:RIP metalloprotease RseP [Chloroflexota bacterium]
MFDFLLGNDALSTIFAFILVLIPAVFIHELGHFLAAKAVGITILEFGIGFPPRLVRLFTYRGTEYTLNWLPLGGFVRPLGEDFVRPNENEEAHDREEARQRGVEKMMTVNEAKPPARLLFLTGGALANFVLAVVLLMLAALMGLPETVGARVNVISLPANSVLANSGLQAFDAIESINGETFDDSGDFARSLEALDGELVTLTVRRAEEPDAVQALTFTPDFSETAAAIDTHPLVAGVSVDSPAESAGLQVGDLIMSFNGETITNFPDLQQRTRENVGQEVDLVLWRAGEIIETALVPRVDPPPGQGAMGIEVGDATINQALGLVYQEGAPQVELQSQPVGEAMTYSVNRIGEVVGLMAALPGEIIRGTAEPEELRLASPLGVSQVGSFFLQESIQRNQPGLILEFVALISIALGITNLLPIPPLDGGRILFVIVEIVRGRPIAPEREGMVHLIGFALLLSLMVVTVLNDIANPLTDLLR